MTTTGTASPATFADTVEHFDSKDEACSKCGHFGTGSVPGCTCPGCDDTDPCATGCDAPTQLHQKEATTPGSIADLIVTALYNEGGRVLVRNADDAWATGFVVVKMLDGTDVRVNIELD